MTLKEELKRKALELGFVKAGVTSADNFDGYYNQEQLDAYYHFLKVDSRNILGNALHIKENFPQAKSILSVVYSYGNIAYPQKLTTYIGRAYQARCYGPVRGSVNGERIQLLKEYVLSKGIHILENCYVPDRAAAARAGCITFGKNNFAYCGEYGSFIIITNLVLDVELEPDIPTMIRECPENCQLCIKACPTGAIELPGRLCPQKCIGFNNWFNQSEKGQNPFVPEEIRPKLGLHLHGCDVCQEVCPRNRKILNATRVKDPFLETLSKEFDLEKILVLDDAYYESVIKPIMYNYIKDYRYFRRNAAIVMGNTEDVKYLPALKQALGDSDPLIQDAARWAIERIEGIQKNA